MRMQHCSRDTFALCNRPKHQVFRRSPSFVGPRRAISERGGGGGGGAGMGDQRRAKSSSAMFKGAMARRFKSQVRFPKVAGPIPPVAIKRHRVASSTMVCILQHRAAGCARIAICGGSEVTALATSPSKRNAWRRTSPRATTKHTATPLILRVKRGRRAYCCQSNIGFAFTARSKGSSVWMAANGPSDVGGESTRVVLWRSHSQATKHGPDPKSSSWVLIPEELREWCNWVRLGAPPR